MNEDIPIGGKFDYKNRSSRRVNSGYLGFSCRDFNLSAEVIQPDGSVKTTLLEENSQFCRIPKNTLVEFVKVGDKQIARYSDGVDGYFDKDLSERKRGDTGMIIHEC